MDPPAAELDATAISPLSVVLEGAGVSLWVKGGGKSSSSSEKVLGMSSSSSQCWLAFVGGRLWVSGGGWRGRGGVGDEIGGDWWVVRVLVLGGGCESGEGEMVGVVVPDWSEILLWRSCSLENSCFLGSNVSFRS